MKTHLTETYLKAARIHLVILHCSLGKPLRICFPILRVYHSLIMIVRNVFISINKRMSKHSHILFSILHQSLHFTCIKLPSSIHTMATAHSSGKSPLSGNSHGYRIRTFIWFSPLSKLVRRKLSYRRYYQPSFGHNLIEVWFNYYLRIFSSEIYLVYNSVYLLLPGCWLP